MVKVCIIGAGVSGLSCAVRIKEKYPHYEVIVVSKEFSPNTTGDGSAGLWGPFLLKDTPDDKIYQWSKETHDFFFNLWRIGEAGSCLLPCIRISSEKPSELPIWKDVVFGFKELSADDIKAFKFSDKIKSAFSFITFTCEPKKLLPYLMKKFSAMGGIMIEKYVKSLSTYLNGDYDIVINCTGLGSRDLVPDKSTFAIRGQVARVIAPWVYQIILDESDDGNYIIPNMHDVVLGGTHQIDDYNINPDPKDRKFIFEGCHEMIPGLKHSETKFEWVGLRPGRDSVRLEKEEIYIKGNKKVYLIHNYGHGGSGVTLCWGCAGDVIEIIKNINSLKSKL